MNRIGLVNTSFLKHNFKVQNYKKKQQNLNLKENYFEIIK